MEVYMSQAYPNKQNTHALAIISLVLSILGMMPILPVVGSIGGIVTGVIARREIRANPDQLTGDGMAKAGIILGWIGIALAALVIIALILFMIPVSTTSIPQVETLIVPVQP
jgi:hypothetical protein